MNTKAKLAMGLMFLISTWFGLQAWLTQSGIHASSALAFNTERYTLAALVMGGVCLVTRAKFTKQAVWGGFMVGVVFAIMIGLESQSLGHGSAGRVTFLGSLFVAIMPFLAHFVRSEKLYPAAIMGSAVMLVGAWQLLFMGAGSSIGDLYGILRALTCAIMLLLVGRYAQADWRVSSFINLTVVAIISLAGSVMTGQTQFSLQIEVLAPVMVSALLGSVICVAAMTWSGRYLSGSLMGVLFFLDAPFSIIWGIFLFKETFSPTSLTAYILIAIGAFFALTAGTLRIPQFNLQLVERLKVRRVSVE